MLRASHAAYFLRLAEQAEEPLWSRDWKVWMQRLDADQDNLRAALEWAVAAERAETALRLVGALDW
ncbi:MAG: hypothetical protein ACR2PL_05840 [Dehalococcoidia bacterium]